MPFKAAISSFGSPSDSVDTFYDLQVIPPMGTIALGLEYELFEVSPFNYGLYIDIVQFGYNGTYFISDFDFVSINISISLSVTG